MLLIYYSGISPTVQKLNYCETVVAIVLSISSFTVSSATFVVLGFVCGYCFSQKRNKWTSNETRNITLASEFSITDNIDEGLELKENVAYGTVQSTLHTQQLTMCQHH